MLGTPAFAYQTDEAIIVVDVMVVNDNGGTNDGTTVPFVHPALAGGTTTGMDSNTDVKCLTTDGGECYIQSIPVGAGEITVEPVPGYTITIECRTEGTLNTDGGGEPVEDLDAEVAAATASGSTWTADPNTEIFCTVMLDDDAPVDTTTTTAATTTTTTTTTLPPTTIAPTTAAPTTIPTPEPAVALPETGPSHVGWIGLVAVMFLALGTGTIRLARR